MLCSKAAKVYQNSPFWIFNFGLKRPMSTSGHNFDLDYLNFQNKDEKINQTF